MKRVQALFIVLISLMCLGAVQYLIGDGRYIVNINDILHTSSGDRVLTEGQIGQKSNEDTVCFHGGGTGEVQDAACLSLLTHVAITFDPEGLCTTATIDRLFLFTVGDDMLNGFTVVEWKLSFDDDPTAQIGASELHLKWADAMIGVGNAAEMDDLETSSGVASEDTVGSINGGTAVANGSVIYLQFDTAYEEVGHTVLFEMWGYTEED